MFDYETQIRNLTQTVVEEQRSALASFYGCDTTISVPGITVPVPTPAAVQAPIVPADEIEPVSHSDGILAEYPRRGVCPLRHYFANDFGGSDQRQHR